MRILEDFFNDIDIEVKDNSNNEFSHIMTAHTTKQLCFYVINDEHEDQQPQEYYMKIIRDRWNKDTFWFNKLLSQIEFIQDYKLSFGIANIGDRLYMDNVPYKFYDDRKDFIENGLKEFEICPKSTDTIDIIYKVEFKPNYKCTFKEFTRDLQNYWKYYSNTGNAYMRDLYFYDRNNQKIGMILIGLKKPFRFEKEVSTLYNAIFDTDNEQDTTSINKRSDSSQRQPKFVQFILWLYRKQGITLKDGYWIKPYGYNSYFTSSYEQSNRVAMLFYIDNEDKTKLKYEDIAQFTLNNIIPRMIDGLGWNGVLKHNAYVTFCSVDDDIDTSGMKKDIEPIAVEEETSAKVFICFADGIYTKDIQHHKRRTLIPYGTAAEKELIDIINNTIYK